MSLDDSQTCHLEEQLGSTAGPDCDGPDSDGSPVYRQATIVSLQNRQFDRQLAKK